MLLTSICAKRRCQALGVDLPFHSIPTGPTEKLKQLNDTVVAEVLDQELGDFLCPFLVPALVRPLCFALSVASLALALCRLSASLEVFRGPSGDGRSSSSNGIANFLPDFLNSHHDAGLSRSENFSDDFRWCGRCGQYVNGSGRQKRNGCAFPLDDPSGGHSMLR
jgi:hypothetical protein